MIENLKKIKEDIIINLSYMRQVLKSLEAIEDKRLNSNKLKSKKTWLSRLY
tara:strand:+ start:23386 stop:23538 length:153 start_codon:yes stop_codon:yes gene_type:complete